MSDLLSKASHLMQSIEQMTQDIVENINSNKLEEANLLLNDRIELLSELIAAFNGHNNNQNVLLDFLLRFQKRDQEITQAVQQEFNVIKNTLTNLNQLKKYITV